MPGTNARFRTVRRSPMVGSVLALGAVVLAGCVSETPSTTAAGNFPERPVTVIVPFSAGGGTDLSMRALAEEAKRTCGTGMTISNVDGGAGAVGMQQVAEAAPDGYTLAVATSSTYLSPHFGTSQLRPDQFRGIMQYDNDPPVISVKADSPYKTIDDFLAAAENNKKLTVGTSGAGSITQVAFMGMADAAGVPVPTNVPFDGGSEAITGALGGQVDAVSATAGESFAHIESGRLRALVSMSDQRLEMLPNVPTLKEMDINWSIPVWRGLVAPADTPDGPISALHACMKKAYDTQAFQSFMNKQSFGPTYKSQQDFSAFLRAEYKRYDRLVEELGLGGN